MKKALFLLCVMVALFACSQPEDEVLAHKEIKGINSRAMETGNQKPDVYVETGCFIVKNLNVRDSIVYFLAKFNDEQRIAWEKKLGFVSAKTYYAPYFYEYDNVKSEEECHLFAEKYASILSITTDEEGCISVEYPFASHDFEMILSPKGTVIIGKTLYIYKEDRRVMIHFADQERISKYSDASFSSEDDFVDVIYNHDAQIFFRGNISQDLSLKNSGGYLKSGKKKYKWDLIYTWERVMEDNNMYFRNYTYLKLHQRARKKYLGGWHDYDTDYSIRNVDVSINGCGLFEHILGDEKSIGRKSGANFNFFCCIGFERGSIGVMKEGAAKLYISVKADHKSSFLDWSKAYHLDYSGEVGSVSEGVYPLTNSGKLFY